MVEVNCGAFNDCHHWSKCTHDGDSMAALEHGALSQDVDGCPLRYDRGRDRKLFGVQTPHPPLTSWLCRR
ncbi:hypothetical protein TNIN_245081 [Trichonephila inaurata madagascariensis]|uniref:Uncharacterized protein n=1 Tax=Trichonephila inaurata madagascariensis TaxID=2747483 RepID=A0A8X7C882_9ARAC|nr:hypothetical protein TNIN_245081 [Trichonephila inaurata madagascariensis]